MRPDGTSALGLVAVKPEVYCGVQGFDQRMIDVYLDAFRTEVRIESAGGAGQVLISPFSSQQPASTHVRYHMPPRFSKEVVRGIRHAAAKAFQVRLQLLSSTSWPHYFVRKWYHRRDHYCMIGRHSDAA